MISHAPTLPKCRKVVRTTPNHALSTPSSPTVSQHNHHRVPSAAGARHAIENSLSLFSKKSDSRPHTLTDCSQGPPDHILLPQQPRQTPRAPAVSPTRFTHISCPNEPIRLGVNKLQRLYAESEYLARLAAKGIAKLRSVNAKHRAQR